MQKIESGSRREKMDRTSDSPSRCNTPLSPMTLVYEFANEPRKRAGGRIMYNEASYVTSHLLLNNPEEDRK